MGRRWGQHFLSSRQVVDKIVSAAALGPSDRVLEIGPGEGVLTEPMLALAGEVHAFEIDPDLASRLEQKEHPKLTVHRGDFLKSPLDFPPGPDWKVVANLPYYITAPILERLLWQRPVQFSVALLMMQEEVARRICEPASRQAGALTYIAGAFHQVKYLFKVPPGCFKPPPKVDSAVVHIIPSPGPASEEVAPTYERLVAASFQARRKQLGRSLRSVAPTAAEILEKAGVSPERRPETLTVQEFWTLARTWADSV